MFLPIASSFLYRHFCTPMEQLPVRSIRAFEAYLLLELNRSRLTAEAYCRDLRQFAEWISADPEAGFAPGSVTATDIRAWLTALARKGDTPRSLRRKTQSLRAYWRYLMKRGEASENPAADVALAKTDKPLPEFARPEEIEPMLTPPGSNEKELPMLKMARVIMLLLYTTGIRQAELLALTDTDLRVTACEAVITGKRNKQRVVPIAPDLMEEIKDWQSVRNQHFPELSSPRPLFVGPSGSRLSKSTLYRIVRAHLSSTSATHKGAHTLRHTFATAMLNGGAALDTVKEFLGHESLATTQIYTHLSYSQLLQDYRKAHPREIASCADTQAATPEEASDGEALH